MTLLLLALACAPVADGELAARTPLAEDDLADGVHLGPVQTCTEPATDLRLTDVAAAWGLDVEIDPPWGGITSFSGGLVTEDIDADGDIDVIIGRVEGAPRVLGNDGTGHFTELDPPFSDTWDTWGPATALSAVDLDGDGLPELALAGNGWAAVAPNLGAGRWGEPALAWMDEAEMRPLFVTMSWGDLDQDGDLDLFLPGLDHVPASVEATMDPAYSGRGTLDVMLRNDDGELVFDHRIGDPEVPGYSMYATFTDRDRDGDADLLVSSVHIEAHWEVPDQTFYRNDTGTLTEDGTDLGVDLHVSGMGGDISDVNGDGLPDYFISDTDRLVLLLSTPDGPWVEGARAMGLFPDVITSDAPEAWWSGWSMVAEDLDADGWLEVAVPAGDEVHPSTVWAPWDAGWPADDSPAGHRDSLFQGSADGWTDVSEAAGVADLRDHYSMASADLDGDGFLELVTTGAEGPAIVWRAGCTEGAWVAVELVGPPDNAMGIGAWVEVEAGGRTWGRPMLSTKALAQEPSRLSFGLGDVDRVDRIRVTWPDGSETALEDLAPRRVVTLAAPYR